MAGISGATIYALDEQHLDLRTYQLQRLNQLLLFAKQNNEFYKEKLRDVSLPLLFVEDILTLPFTSKSELVKDQQEYPLFGRNYSYPETSYVRYHQTSGTTGRPLKVLDTPESWRWWTKCWTVVLGQAGVTPRDRLFLAFSFGPFIGFWAAYEAAKEMGALVITGGGQSSVERLNIILDHRVTVLLCTPSYALHLVEVAKDRDVDLRNSAVRLMVVGGEPGASMPAVRALLEDAWGAKCFDHAGMTEVGAYSFPCSAQAGPHINEAEFFAEILDPESGQPVSDGEWGELVLTNFGRYGYPVIRYRTGDIVIRLDQPCSCGHPFRLLPGGVIGRVDDMVVVRGVNIFPQSVESIIREFKDVLEFRIVFYTEEELDQVKVKVELFGGDGGDIAGETAGTPGLASRGRSGAAQNASAV